jgi:hypothetical protein
MSEHALTPTLSRWERETCARSERDATSDRALTPTFLLWDAAPRHRFAASRDGSRSRWEREVLR